MLKIMTKMQSIVLWFVLLGLILPGMVSAQEEDRPLVNDITIGSVVEETITDRAVFDWWQIQLAEGQTIIVEMRASDGLVPLVGLLASGGDLLARSDINAQPRENGSAFLEYTVTDSGQYTIVPTREGNNDGTSTGSYTLSVRLPSDPTERENPHLEVEFRCGQEIVTTALQMTFQEDVQVSEDTPANEVTEFYRLTVYGLDGFDPFIRAEAEVQPDSPLDCSDNAQPFLVGSSYTLPDGTQVTITDEEILENIAQLALRNTGPGSIFGAITLTIGSRDGTRGRYMAVIEGLALQTADDIDSFFLRAGPLAQESEMMVYMIAESDSRLDPFVMLYGTEDELLSQCDDAGRGDCEAMPDATGIGTTIADEVDHVIVGDRFDAGVAYIPGATEAHILDLLSRDHITSGAYTVIFIGELP